MQSPQSTQPSPAPQRNDRVTPVLVRIVRGIAGVVGWCWRFLLDLVWLVALATVVYLVLAVLAHQGEVGWAADTVATTNRVVGAFWHMIRGQEQ